MGMRTRQCGGIGLATRSYQVKLAGVGCDFLKPFWTAKNHHKCHTMCWFWFIDYNESNFNEATFLV